MQHWLYGDEQDLIALSVVLLVGIAKNHAFEQGNKRTAFAACRGFLALNGQYMNPNTDSADFADFIVEVITGERPEGDLISLLRAICSSA